MPSNDLPVPDNDTPDASRPAPNTARLDREARALRANLRRRKQQAAARQARPAEPTSNDDPDA